MSSANQVSTVDISAALAIEGWMSEEELRWLAEQASRLQPHSFIVEIGTYLGRSARAIADNMSFGTILTCADPYVDYIDPCIKITDESAGDALYEKAKENTFNDFVFLRRRSSIELAEMVKDHVVDMVFIDGDHSYESVKADIAAWRSKVKPGGILCGHDYTTYESVHQAVIDSLPVLSPCVFEVVDSIWSVAL